MKILLTGGAGFIGSHLLERLIARGDAVTVVDDLNDYYDPAMKRANLDAARKTGNFTFVERDLRKGLEDLLSCDLVIHLAARAGVRASLADPLLYHSVNVDGTLQLLEAMKKKRVKRMIFASSSSVYGNSPRAPFREDDGTIQPIAPYGSSKLIAERYLRVYTQLYNLHAAVLRFFTVYGPRQRPDMAIRMFAGNILEGEEIPVFGDGSSERDYTYVDDIVHGVMGAIGRDDSFEIYNLGESRTVPLTRLIEVLEQSLGKKARIKRLPEQPGDVKRTYASIDKARAALGYAPSVALEEGIRRFVAWLQRS